MSAVFDLGTVQEATRQGRVLVAHCGNCGAEQCMPAPSCLKCGSENLSIHSHDGKGTLYSWSVTGVAFEPELADEVPYVVAVVLLTGGAKLWCRLDIAPDSPLLRADLPVQLDAQLTRQRGYLVFRARDGAGESN